jgi:hypothetical protein
VVLIGATRLFFATQLVEAMRYLSVDAMIAGIGLLLDIVILSLLCTRPASLWLCSRHAYTVHG